MAIIYPLDMPPTPTAVIKQIFYNRNQTSLEYYDKSKQVMNNPGTRWHAVMSLPILTDAQARAWQGFFGALNGMEGSFKVPWPYSVPVMGAGAGAAAKVVGIHTQGKILASDGWPVSSTVLLRGDVIRFGNLMRQVTQDVISDVGGVASVYLSHEITESIANDTDINTTNSQVWGLFRLSNSNVPYDLNTITTSITAIAIEEVLP